MIVALMMTVEGSRPEISRLLNVEDDLRLDELSPLIDAAFGFSGASSHLFMGTFDDGPALFSATPAKGEREESELTVGEISTMTYVYDPSANWNVRLEVMGTTDVDTPTPMLIDAQGPDIIEPCGGPDMMSAFHTEAQRLAAGLEPDMKVSPLLLSFMPVMSPERLIQRLAYADHPTVSERIAFTAENLFVSPDEEFEEDPRAPELAREFDEFVQSRPELQNLLSLDPNPERNPAVIAAVSEFFADHIPESGEEGLYPFTRIVNNLRAFILYCVEPVVLTKRGKLRAADVRTLAESIGFAVAPGSLREESIPPVGVLRQFLEFMDLLEVNDGMIEATASGLDLAQHPEALLYAFEDELYRYFAHEQGEDAEQALAWLANKAGLGAPVSFAPAPRNPDFLVNLFAALSILDAQSTPEHVVLTAPGRDVLTIMLGLED